jgi:hypothetical protein
MQKQTESSKQTVLFPVIFSVVDPDREAMKLTNINKEIWRNLVYCLSDGLCFWPFTYFKYIFHVKIRLFVTLKSDQDPDPHWVGSLDPDPQ